MSLKSTIRHNIGFILGAILTMSLLTAFIVLPYYPELGEQERVVSIIAVAAIWIFAALVVGEEVKRRG